MATASQIEANRANAQHSTGPITPEGKAAVAQNNFRHGLAGSFMILDWENREEFDELVENLRAEHRPSSPTEVLLVESMARHYWLRQRAQRLQCLCFHNELPMVPEQNQKEFALYLRYQTTHERAFHKSLNDLLKLRAERRKEQIGFESQQARQAGESRKQAAENRKQELHTLAVLLAEAKVTHESARVLDQKVARTMTELAENDGYHTSRAA